MIYAIHNDTKKHLVVPYIGCLASEEWSYSVADAEGWIKWECHLNSSSPLPLGERCDIKHVDNWVGEFFKADCQKWHGPDVECHKIVAYRPSFVGKWKPT